VIRDRRLRLAVGRYVVVGLIGYGLQVGSFSILVLALGVGHVAAAIVAGVLALVSNFVLNRTWTFEAGGADLGRHLRMYVVVVAVFFAAQIAVLSLLVALGVPKVLAEALSVVAVVPANFVAQRRLVFRA
jgi:putative flippase GtrA